MSDFEHDPLMAAEERMTLSVKSPEQVVQISVDSDTSVRTALDATELRARAACGGLGTCGACLIQTIAGDFNPPTLAERQKIPADELAAGMRLACQLRARSRGELYLEYPAPHSQWKSLDSNGLYPAVNGNSRIDHYVYGVAVDLGTTHIRLSLWNRKTGRRIASRYTINPQVAHGADILTRLDAQRLSEDDCLSIGREAREAIIAGIRDILSRDVGEVRSILADIGRVLIVGNTAMLVLVCGNNADNLYRPENWQRAITCLPSDIDAWRKGWRTPHAEITIAQPLAGFIGSDLIADLLATGMTEQPEPMMLADFGTNTEIAVWDGHTVWATSVPGGPAFEGVGMHNGLTAETGAICHVARASGAWRLQTLCGAPARGFCASGFIDAVALLLDEKLLKPSGRFAQALSGEGYRLDANNPRTAIFAGDVDVFQRAKASTAAAMAQLLAFADLQVSDLRALWICGSFGQYLDLNSAFRVGLLPNIRPSLVHLMANASLAGCEKLLLDPMGEAMLNAVLERSHAVNLGGIFEYEERFIDHLRLQPVATVER